MTTHRPVEPEFASFYAGYVSLVPETDVVPALEHQMEEIRRAAAGVPPERESFRYEPGKWSIREVFGHMGDAERVFGYRAFCISRGEEKPLPGFDEKSYVAASGFDRRPLSELVDELVSLRAGNLMFLRALDETSWRRLGNANGHPVSVRALAYIMAGHVRHHLRVLHERYHLET